MFLLQYEECCQVHQGRCQAPIRPFKTLIQLLHYTMIGGERRHANVRVVEQKVALLQCGEKAINKEKDTREARSDACVLINGSALPQPMRGVLQHLTIRGCYLPFTLVLGAHARCIFHHSPRWSRRWHEPKILYLNQCSPFFPHSQPTCRI